MQITRAFGRHPGTWIPPLFILLMLAATLPAIYLGGTLNPVGNLRDLPIGIVVEPQTSTAIDAAEQVSAAIQKGVNHDEIQLVPMTAEAEKDQITGGKISGAIRIPANFNAEIANLVSGTEGAPAHAVVHLDTNPAAGAMSVSLFTGKLTPVVSAVNTKFGSLLPQHATTTAAATALATPFSIATAPLVPLASHTGLGTSAFYYAMVLVLLGFVGASAIHPIVDSAAGFQPSEFGPKVQRRNYIHLPRLHMLLVKWGVMIAAAPLSAAFVQLVAGWGLDMPIPAPLELYLFSTTTVAAVGIGALSVFAVFGAVGPIINMFFFVAMSMTSSAGTVPLEATPPFFRAIATFEPMRPIVAGLRSILYYDSSPLSDLPSAWIRVIIGGCVGAAIGLTVTYLYDRNPAFSRHPSPAVQGA
ncbi:YhgE/Pip domain-containing protein [Nocardia sp. NPDC052278]|uniref:YhgE/Pip domain-containing protein n=1 Tax=unclassified Nocardia TaxID=2637762 RepID=UPI00369494F1